MRRAPGGGVRAPLVGLGLIALAVGLIQLDRREDGVGPVGSMLLLVTSPLQSTVTAAARGLRGVWLDYVALLNMREKERALLAELKAVRQQAAQAADLTAENRRLRRLLELGDRRKDLRLRAARVVSRTTSSYYRVVRITLDVGGGTVSVGMPVIASGGVVGHLQVVQGGLAEVLLITDPRSAIDVVLEESRARGVAKGTGDPQRYSAKLEYLERTAETVQGERVLTTGDDGRYPRNLVVGKVTDVQREDHGLFQDAVVVPLVDLSALDEVFVVLGPTGLTPDGERLKTAQRRAHP